MNKEELKKLFKGQAAKVKLKLDSRTVIYVKTMQALENWLARYPNAQVVAA